MLEHSLTQLAAGLQAREYSSVELTRFFLDRIRQYDDSLRCFITVVEAQALAQAELADKCIREGTAGPLTGIPYAHKDLFCTRDVLTTCGSKMLHNFYAPYDATVTDKLKRSGMVMLGKTNMDEFAMGSSTETSYFGPSCNPWVQTHVPGGSSGGSAAAVSARLAPCATGTDTGGSIRQPASFCGVTGLKPTYGRVSRYGMIAYASSLDQAGVFARSVEDCSLLIQQIGGFDKKDSTSVEKPIPDYFQLLNSSIKKLRIGIPEECFQDGLDNAVKTSIETAMKELAQLGCEIIKVNMTSLKSAIPCYYIIALAECASNLARYDGVRYGYRCQTPVNLEDMYCSTRNEGFGSETKRRIMIGNYVLSAGYYDAYYLKAQKARRKIHEDFATVFKQVDVILMPVAPSTAFKLGEKVNDPVSMYLSDIYTVSVNLAGLPGLAVPVGFDQNLPIGMQLIGNYFCEQTLLALGHQYQQCTDWHKQIPENFV